jgi:hypothetical protein
VAALSREVIFLREHDHAGGNDGNNLQLDLNYGTGLGKEKFYKLGSFQLRDQTGRAGLKETQDKNLPVIMQSNV